MELFKLLGKIAIDNTEAKKALDETTDKAKKSESETSGAFSKIGKAAGTVALGIVGAGSAIGGAFLGAIEGTREYRVEMGKLDTAFVTNGHSSEAAKKTYSDLNAVLGDSGQAVEASNHLALLTDNEKDLQTWTDICTGVYATFGASLPIEGLTEAANETAKVGEVTGPLADALNWAGISEDEFNEKLAACNSEQERQTLIMNTLNDTYKDASAQYQETNKDVIASQKAQERLTDALAEVGAVGEPILTAIKNKIADMAEKAVPKIQSIIDKIKDMKKWFKDNQSTVDAWVAVIIGATTAISGFVLVMKFGSIMSAASKAITGVKTAMSALNLVMRANPIGLVVTLIMGLVAAFIYLWNNNEEFRKFWIGLWDKIKTSCGKAVDWIKNKFDDFKEAAKKVKKAFGDIKDAIAEKIDDAQKAVKKAIDKIKSFFDITLKFKGIKLPKISISWEKGKGLIAKAAELLDLPGVPKFSVKWNAEGALLRKPTLFGAVGSTLLGGGESGLEAVLPVDVLQSYIRDAMAVNTDEIMRCLTAILGYMPIFAENMSKSIYLDGNTLVGHLAPSIDDALGSIERQRLRGNI